MLPGSLGVGEEGAAVGGIDDVGEDGVNDEGVGVTVPALDGGSVVEGVAPPPFVGLDMAVGVPSEGGGFEMDSSVPLEGGSGGPGSCPPETSGSRTDWLLAMHVPLDVDPSDSASLDDESAANKSVDEPGGHEVSADTLSPVTLDAINHIAATTSKAVGTKMVLIKILQ